VGCSIKQRSPAGGRWAEKKIHQIEKMRHCESLIVGVRRIWVKFGGKALYKETGLTRIVSPGNGFCEFDLRT
jgi:hypothetical protein